MAKVAVYEALFRVADRCVQILGGLGVSRDTIVERVFRELLAFRIYHLASEVHSWSIANKIKTVVAAGCGVLARFSPLPRSSPLTRCIFLFSLVQGLLRRSVL